MKKLLILSVCLMLAGGMMFAAGTTETAAPTFKGQNVRVVIGSTATSGDSYLIAETVSRYLGKELGANLKVDAVGAAKALDAMQTSKADGSTIMMFHDMTYLGISFGAYDEMYSLENMTVGPRIAQNPGSAWGAKADAPYKDMADILCTCRRTPVQLYAWLVRPAASPTLVSSYTTSGLSTPMARPLPTASRS